MANHFVPFNDASSLDTLVPLLPLDPNQKKVFEICAAYVKKMLSLDVSDLLMMMGWISDRICLCV